MEMGIVSDLLGNYVFPIGACVAMGYYTYTQGKFQQEILKDNMKSTQEITDKFVDALDRNTEVIGKLLNKLEDDD